MGTPRFVSDDQAEKFFKPGFISDEQADAFFASPPKGERGVGGVALGASKELGRGPLSLIDWIPAVAAGRALGILPKGFDEALAGAEEKLRPQGETEERAATGTAIARDVGLMASGGAALPGIGAVPGVVGTAARAVVAHPKATGAVLGAAHGVLTGNPLEAILGGAAGAGFPLGVGALVRKFGPSVAQALAARVAAGAAPAVESAVPAVEAAVPTVASAVAQRRAATGVANLMEDVVGSGAAPAGSDLPPYVAGLARSARAAAGPAVPSAATAAAPVADAGVSAATRTAALMAFARQHGRKLGEKVWALLDEAGMPVKALTPDQAAAATRRGLPVSWAIKVGP